MSKLKNSHIIQLRDVASGLEDGHLGRQEAAGRVYTVASDLEAIANAEARQRAEIAAAKCRFQLAQRINR